MICDGFCDHSSVQGGRPCSLKAAPFEFLHVMAPWLLQVLECVERQSGPKALAVGIKTGSYARTEESAAIAESAQSSDAYQHVPARGSGWTRSWPPGRLQLSQVTVARPSNAEDCYRHATLSKLRSRRRCWSVARRTTLMR
jgi:hypothetical protein